MCGEGRVCTGKKTPGGAGTHTGHTGHTGARGHTDHTDEPHNEPPKPSVCTAQISTTDRTHTREPDPTNNALKQRLYRYSGARILSVLDELRVDDICRVTRTPMALSKRRNAEARVDLKTAYVDALEHPRSYLAFRKVKWWAAQGRWLRGGNLDDSNRYNAVRHLPSTYR